MNRKIFIPIIIIIVVAVAGIVSLGRVRSGAENEQTAVLASAARGERSTSGEGNKSADTDAPGLVGEEAPGTTRDVFISARTARQAPAIVEGGTWINSDQLMLDTLRGRVVLVDFWTYGCYNCRNTLPTLKRLDAQYRDKGLTIVGVHTPESNSERNINNVRSRVGSLGIEYPVVTDNDYNTWRAYGVEAWPTIVILDKQGRIRFTHIGEGLYREQEQIIKTLLAEDDNVNRT